MDTTASPQTLPQAVRGWIDQAKAKLADGALGEADLAELAGLVDAAGQLRQRLLYLHTASPSPASQVMAMYRVEPVPGGAGVDLTPEPEFPYPSVHDALRDGWQVVRFPEYANPVQDREIDVQGYQFILQKLEVYRDQD